MTTLTLRACFKKNSSLHIWPLAEEFLNDLFYLSKILMTFFLVIALFYDLLPYHI